MLRHWDGAGSFPDAVPGLEGRLFPASHKIGTHQEKKSFPPPMVQLLLHLFAGQIDVFITIGKELSFPEGHVGTFLKDSFCEFYSEGLVASGFTGRPSSAVDFPVGVW
jgi:hypothetical protein